MKATDMLNKVKEVLGVELNEEAQEVKLAQATLENGTVIESEDFAAGSEVFIVTEDEKVALPVGEYSLEDGEMLKVEEEGIIASIGAAEEAPEEEVEATEEEMGYATKEELAEVKEMIEEIKAMLEPKEEMSSEEVEETKEELSEEVTEEVKEEVELSIEEPVAKVTHNPEKEEKVNLNLYGQKREMTTADRVLSKIANIKK
jgi:prolyl oligopeptidase PreP (S9A serine peptidase family)